MKFKYIYIYIYIFIFSILQSHQTYIHFSLEEKHIIEKSCYYHHIIKIMLLPSYYKMLSCYYHVKIMLLPSYYKNHVITIIL